MSPQNFHQNLDHMVVAIMQGKWIRYFAFNFSMCASFTKKSEGKFICDRFLLAKNGQARGFEPRGAGWEAWMPPLCHSVPQNSLLSFKIKRERWNVGRFEFRIIQIFASSWNFDRRQKNPKISRFRFLLFFSFCVSLVGLERASKYELQALLCKAWACNKFLYMWASSELYLQW